MNAVLLDAARMLERAARATRRLSKLDTSTNPGQARSLLSDARANVQAALARMHLPAEPEDDRTPFTS